MAVAENGTRRNSVTAAICVISAVILLVLISSHTGSSARVASVPLVLPQHYADKQRAIPNLWQSPAHPAPTSQPTAQQGIQAAHAAPAAGTAQPSAVQQPAPQAQPAAAPATGQPSAVHPGGIKEPAAAPAPQPVAAEPDPKPWSEIAAFTADVARSIADDQAAAGPTDPADATEAAVEEPPPPNARYIHRHEDPKP